MRKNTKRVSRHRYKTAVAMGQLYMSSPYLTKKEKKQRVIELWDNL